MIFFLIISTFLMIFLYSENKKHQRNLRQLLGDDYDKAAESLKKMLGGSDNGDS